MFQKIELRPFENSRKPQLYMGMKSHVGGGSTAPLEFWARTAPTGPMIIPLKTFSVNCGAWSKIGPVAPIWKIQPFGQSGRNLDFQETIGGRTKTAIAPLFMD